MPDGPDASLPPCVIFDIDGTLALLGDRSPFDASTCEHDEINEAVQFISTFFSDQGIGLKPSINF